MRTHGESRRSVNLFNRIERCLAVGALLVGASGVVGANDHSPLQKTARWSWQEPQAKVLPTGDLEWAPQPWEGPWERHSPEGQGEKSQSGEGPQTRRVAFGNPVTGMSIPAAAAAVKRARPENN
jgi:hypothetical protein